MHKRRSVIAALFAEATPLDLRILGRVLLHAVAVGAAAGLAACAFYYALEWGTSLVLSYLSGYDTVNASGEMGDFPRLAKAVPRPWLLLLLPAGGALLAGILAQRYAPECEGAGGDAVIAAFHQDDSHIRKRVIWLKPLTSLLTLITGGAGGREGPTMHIGGAIGSTVARALRTTPRERRILLVAGMAAGTSAIFRTPLGAALLAVEVLYRDDFEADALIPAVLASVVAYSVFISVHGDGTLFATAKHYPFVISHLPLYAIMTVMLAAVASGFVTLLRRIERLRNRWPSWSRAGIGGLAVGTMAMLGVLLVGPQVGMSILGGGYGAAQAAITGADWLPPGLDAVKLLLLLCGAKLVAASFTVGTGGSAGAFAPSLAIGALFGGAFGHAVQYFFDLPNVDPGSFALVGMGAFYGGIAHAPLGALVLVCELAGSYDLLVPLMLAEGIAFLALRKRSLYRQQMVSLNDSPAHPRRVIDVLKDVRVSAIMAHQNDFVSFDPGSPVSKVMRDVAETGWQDVFPVVDKDKKVIGMITPALLRLLAAEKEMAEWALAVDAMQPAITISPNDNLRLASERMVAHGLREILVVDETNRVAGFVDEVQVGQAYLDATEATAE